MAYIQIIISALTLIIALLGFVLSKQQKIAIQDKSETIALWIDELRPLDWYVTVKSRKANSIIGTLVFFLVMAISYEPMWEFSKPAREFGVEFVIVPLLAAMILSSVSTKFGEVMIALISGEKDKYYGREFTLIRFFINGLEAFASLLVFTAVSVTGFYFLVAIPFEGSISNDVVLIGAVITSLPIIWQLLMVVGVFLILSISLMALMVAKIFYLLLQAITWKVAIHQEGAWVAITLIVAVITGALSFFTINYSGG